MNWLAALFLRPLAPLLVAGAILRILRVQHPASQHAVWFGALVGMLAIAPLSLVAPRWNLAVYPVKPAPALHSALPPELPAADPCALAPADPAAALNPSRQPAQPRPRPESRTAWFALYLAGVMAVGARQLSGRLLLLRLLDRARPLAGPLAGRLYESADVVVPVTAGCFSPKVVLPAGWREWPAATRRAVLRHEFAHIRRGDLRAAAWAACARALLWFHPLAWWLSRRITALAEMACDASVVERSSRPGDYCRLLLEFTGQVARAGNRATLPGLAMAEAGGLDLRVERVFQASRGGLRKLRHPGLVLAFGMAPALCLAAAVDFGPSAIPVRRTIPWRILMFFQGQHVGQLAPDLVPGETAQTLRMLPAADAERAALPVRLSAQDRVFSGSDYLNMSQSIKLALVEPAVGDPYVFADINRNGAFDPAERFTFAPPRGRTILKYPEVILKVEYRTGPYAVFPVRLLLPEDRIYRMDPKGDGGRYLLRSPFVFVHGTVEIGGAPVAAMFTFDANKGDAYPDYGWLGMDTNGDGWIDQRANSEESTFANDEAVIFHVNGRDVSTVSLDLKTGTFVVREHPSGDNQRILLRVGDMVGDFPFTGLDGKPHRFSEFQGRYVLLDFWGSWCGPCRRELPDLEKAYQQFRGRGLAILGMDDDTDTAKARQALTEAGATFPQSSGEAGNALVYKRFRISRFPTKVLLGPDGRVIALDTDGSFDRSHITATLDKLLPPAK